MVEATGRASIPLPIDACWAKLRDLNRAKFYVPGLEEVEIVTEAKEGVGASRTVGGGTYETVVDWVEGRGFTLRLHDVDGNPRPPFSDARFTYMLEPVDADSCAIVTTMAAEGAGDGFPAEAFERAVNDVALALAEHYVTGEKVGPERLAELREGAS